jgi:CubicO group peptidase (beta-lactamase class C family)
VRFSLKESLMKKSPWLVPGALVFLLLAGNSGAVEMPAPERSKETEKAIRLIQTEMPSLLAQTFVRGATIALIEGGSVAWQGSFGSKNAETGEPMTPTRSSAASLSKPVFAYGVMSSWAAGLDLDKPLVEYIDEPSSSAYPRRGNGDLRL